MAMRTRTAFLAGFLLAGAPVVSWADIYIYRGPDGKRVISDQPVQEPGFRLEHRRGSVRDVGHIAAGREQELDQRSQGFYDPYILQACEKYNVDPALVKAVIRVESNFNPLAVSPKGAQGLMQVMPQTAARYREKDMFSPIINIQVGTRHLAYLMKRYSDNLPLVLAAYNAGEENVDRYKGIPPFRETQGYVKRVIRYHNRYSTDAITVASSSL